jgi:dUTP pyrophosphatase
MNTMQVSMVHAQAKAPYRATPGAAGYDLYACEDMVIQPGDRELINIGVIIVLPNMTYARVAPRSGMALRGIDVGAGVIDSDYRGAVQVLLINNSKSPYEVKAGDRVAQLIVECILTPRLFVADYVASTERGSGGFGSSGWR